MKFHTALLFLSAALTACPALAQVDQRNGRHPSGWAVGTSVSVFSPAGQSFTPTLTSIDFATFRLSNFDNFSSTLNVSVFAGNSSFTAGNALGTSANVILGPGRGYSEVQFDFANPITLVPGSLYSLIINDLTVKADADRTKGAYVITGSSYAGGDRIFAGQLSVDEDLYFIEGVRAVPSAVPEPATWALMLVGFGMVGGAARYRRRSAKITYA